jgi:hypothetical protein
MKSLGSGIIFEMRLMIRRKREKGGKGFQASNCAGRG